MKKTVFTIVIVLLLAFAFANGITPAYVYRAPGVAAGIGAKLLCSSVYVSGFSRDQAFSDLVQYSPLLERLSIEYDDDNRQVHTSFFGLSPTTASYVDGLGCANDYDGYTQRAGFEAQALPVFSSHWPHGNRVETINGNLQSLTDALVAQDNSEGLNTRALLVVHQGQIVAESYAQESGPETPLLGWSMAKSLMSVMIGNLEYRGLLSPEAPAGFTAWQGDERQEIRIQDLLTMTDGLDFSEEYNPGDDATTMLFTEASASDYVLGRPLAHTPGTHFNYSSGTANLLSRLHHDRTGGTLTDSLMDYRRHIAVPMSFQHTVFETDASGVLVGSSYFYASARDWARLGQLMLDDGVLNGHRIVSRDWVQRAVTPNDSENGRAYGYQWWLNSGGSSLRWPDLPANASAAQGNRQQYVMVIPDSDTVIVRLGWTSGRYPASERFARIVQALPTE
jgi:CubicO group peptidase (beta-lactamase class C family)